MKYFNDKEHIGCQYYTTEIKNGFRYIEIEKGLFPVLKERKQHCLIWLLDGKLSISVEDIGKNIFQAGEMIYIPQYTEYKGTVLDDSKILILLYEEPIYMCDKTYNQLLDKDRNFTDFEFKGLKINEPMNVFARTTVQYLKDKIHCFILHELKQKELTLIFRTYYDREEKANLFYYFIGRGSDFKRSVKNGFPLVKNVEELAKLCGYEYKTFLRMFHEHFYMPPYQWMQEQTALQIQSRLTEKNVPIKTIAKEFNFSSAAHFTTYCKRIFGATPMQIRKNMKK